MIRSPAFALVTAADFIVRAAYQMGKTPLLPIFAQALGAGFIFIGLISSVSTLTGMLLKPFVGVLSDRWGRRGWLLLGTAIFAGAPFLYRFVQTPEHLFALRMAHGLATAIYGPVTLAYVAELSRKRRAERIGWFSSARSAGYVVGPIAAGWLLLHMAPVQVFTVIGIVSCLAFLPVLLLPETPRSATTRRVPLARQTAAALRSATSSPAIWLAGGLEATMVVATYGARTFLPLHILSIGGGVFLAGAFFSAQQAVHLALNPLGGRFSDRIGHLPCVGIGTTVLAVALGLLTVVETQAALLGSAMLMGAAQALVVPSTLGLVAANVDERHLGAGLGLVGSLRNAAKVAGPILAGAMVYWLDFAGAFRMVAALLLVSTAVVWVSSYRMRLAVRRTKAAAA